MANQIITLKLTTNDTQYGVSVNTPASLYQDIVGFSARLRSAAAFRVAYKAGEVAAEGATDESLEYRTIPAGGEWRDDTLSPRRALTLYFATDADNQVVEIELYTY